MILSLCVVVKNITELSWITSHHIDYLMGNDLFFHSGNEITRKQMIKLFESTEEAENE